MAQRKGSDSATCYVCNRAVEEVPIREQLAAQRGMNIRVSIGPNLYRHSYCAPGTERWLAAMQDGRELTERDRFWIGLYLGER